MTQRGVWGLKKEKKKLNALELSVVCFVIPGTAGSEG